MHNFDSEPRASTTIEPPPSRFDNPFATCWTRPGALSFQFPSGCSAANLIARLAANGWRGAIIGPHGAGKSTLLEHLKPLLVAEGRSVAAIALRDGQRRLPHDWLGQALEVANPLVVIDGYEQLSLVSRVLLRWRCRLAKAGLIVTSHRPTALPTLIELQPSRALVDQLVARLTADVPSLITSADVAAGYAGHGSNVRDLFFTLYGRHEQLRRIARTEAVRGT